MKSQLTTLILALLPLFSFAQNHHVYQHSQDLKLTFEEEGKLYLSNEKVLELLTFYSLKSFEQKDSLLEYYKDNPFFEKYLLLAPAPNPIDSIGGAVVELDDIVTPSYLLAERRAREAKIEYAKEQLLTNPTTAAAAFLTAATDFLIKRTKEELHITFFKEFQSKTEDSEEMRYLFPKTTEVLSTLDEDIYRFNAFWEAIRASFVEDLNKMFGQLSLYLQQTEKIQDEGLRAFAADLFFAIDLLRIETPPTEIIHYLGEESLLQDTEFERKELQVIQENLSLMNILSEAVVDPNEKGYWIEPLKIRQLAKDTIVADFFLGLLYERSKDVKMGQETFSNYLKDLAGLLDKKRQFFREVNYFLMQAERVEIALKELKNKEKRSRTAGRPVSEEERSLQHFKFANECLSMVNYVYIYKKRMLGASPKEDSLFREYMRLANQVNQLTYEIQAKRYALAIITTINIIEKLIPEDQWACEQRNLLKYGSFIATAAFAKSSEEVSDAIEAFALPPGSAAMKKYANFSISLNAYVGAAAGSEYLEGLNYSPYYAIATPIGISLNKGFRKAGSASLLFSLLDLGALTAYRFDTDNTEALPDLRVENVLAPGAYVVYGLPRFPLSIGFGGQLGPNLRSVTNNNLNLTKSSGWRFGAFLAVDIPLINFYTTNKRYKACK